MDKEQIGLLKRSTCLNTYFVGAPHEHWRRRSGKSNKKNIWYQRLMLPIATRNRGTALGHGV